MNEKGRIQVAGLGHRKARAYVKGKKVDSKLV